MDDVMILTYGDDWYYVVDSEDGVLQRCKTIEEAEDYCIELGVYPRYRRLNDG